MMDGNSRKRDHQVFISYANDKTDRKVAEKIFKALKAKNIRCWIAPRNSEPGQEWPDEVSKAIKQSKVIILVSSLNSNKSRFVRKEVTQAGKKWAGAFKRSSSSGLIWTHRVNVHGLVALS